MRVRAPLCLALLCCVAATAAAAPPVPGGQIAVAPLSTPLRLAAPARPAKRGSTKVYIVKLRESGAASYGGADILAAGGRTQSDSAQRAARASYAQRLEQTHDRLLSEIGASATKVYSYRYAMNGFAARLTPEEASRLAQHPEVERIWPDSDRRVDTNNSSTFLGLENPNGGLHADLKLRGENVVVGVVDSGIAPNHPSLLDTVDLIPRPCRSQWAKSSLLGLFLCSGYNRRPLKQVVYPAPVGFSGKCETGPGFAPGACNNKVVGARFYIDGFLQRHTLDPHEFRSPRDAAGHGTHVATTIAGNAADAVLFGTKVARVMGLAPRARVAVYKACWVEAGGVSPTCTTSDVARAVDDAVADGVDLINYSLGTTLTDLTAPDGLALLNAFDAGVLTMVAAGNDGPDYGTITAPSSAPWVLAVGASTQTGTVFDDAIAVTAPTTIAGSIGMREASFTPALTSKSSLQQQLVLALDAPTKTNGANSSNDACTALTNARAMKGHIALIVRGGCEFQVKVGNAEAAGAVGVVVYNDSGAPIVMNGDAGSVHIPAVMISSADGQRLVTALAGTQQVTVKLARGVFVSLTETGNTVADFSSRGPAQSDANFLKPDVTAPGVDILAGTTPTPANGVQGERYTYYSGTSQAAPEVTGIAALLKEAHPEWPPGTLKSALMTSSYQQQVVNSDGQLANPFDRGAGHVNPNRAIDPGLVYASAYRDHAAYLCGLLKPPYPSADCAAIAAAGFSSAPTDLNLPSIAIAELITGDVVKRRVTNVGPPATYSAALDAPPDVDVAVNPASLALGTGQSAEFSMTFTNRAAPLDQWSFGELRWSDGTRTVASPIAVQPVALRAAPEVRLSGSNGTAALPVAFGYDGNYTPRVHGLRAPLTDSSGRVLSGHVDDDPSNAFSLNGPGVTLHGFTVPAGQLYLRIALFDEFTDGHDDLDLYLFFCPDGTTNNCSQIGQSGSFTSNEEIDITKPTPGLYVAAVHGFETDQVAGGPGANYSIFIWSLGSNDDVGNLTVAAPSAVSAGDRVSLALTWSQLAPAMRYLGAISHETPSGVYALTFLDVATP